MRVIDRLPNRETLEYTDTDLSALSQWLTIEIEDAFSSRSAQESIWLECLRQYEALGTDTPSPVPIEGVKVIEVPLGAIAADALYAQMLDIVFVTSPTITAQPVGEQGKYVPHAKAIQRLINIGEKRFALRSAAEHSLLDDVQIGTGIYYTRWAELAQKTNTHKVLSAGPQIRSVPPEDFIVPAGIEDNLQLMDWCAMRVWLTESQAQTRAKLYDWIATPSPAADYDWVRTRRELLARSYTSGERRRRFYEVIDVYCYYDIDGDGIAEDLLVTWDRTSKRILKIGYNPFDSRPFSAMRYQMRPHMFYGLGVIEMLRTMQDEVTQIHNHRNLNQLIANTRIWAARSGIIPDTMRVWPNRVLQMADPDAIKPLQVGDVYPSSFENEASVLSLAERRVGINELTQPRPSQVIGSRTPGVTMNSMLQQANRRFTPAFDGMRLATSEAVNQCLYRWGEKLQAGDPAAEKLLADLLGETDAALAHEILTNPDFEQSVSVQITASSAQVNREIERQNGLQLVGVLGQYYQQVLNLAIVAANPQTPPAVAEVAEKIAKAASEIIDRTVRTFDQVRDPSTFLISLSEAVDQVQQPQQPGTMDMLQQLLSGGGSIPPAPNPQGPPPIAQ